MKQTEMRQKISYISVLAFELSNKEYNDESANGLPVAMIHMAGHVGMISVDLHEHGWESGCSPTKRYEVYYHGEFDRYQTPEVFDEIIAEMNRLIDIRENIIFMRDKLIAEF